MLAVLAYAKMLLWQKKLMQIVFASMPYWNTSSPPKRGTNLPYASSPAMFRRRCA